MSDPVSAATPAAEWRGISRRFGGDGGPRGAPALDNLQLAVHPGEFLTLLGPSGCGKTTALRLLSGLDSPDSGQIFLAGQDVTALPPHRREVNQVFQSYALFPHLTVAGNIAFGLRMKRLPGAEITARVDRAAELLALGGLLARRPDALSGGQRQRVAVARALVCEPKVLLLDEPLSALDARLRAQVRGELRTLQRRLGMTFVFVTHDQEEALTLSDRVAVMHAGRLEQIGSPEEIYGRPRNRFVAGFIGEANLLDAEIVGREGGHWLCRLSGVGETILRAPAGADAAPPSSMVGLLIRPEHVRLSAEGGGFSALVHERVFRGADTMLTLSLPSGHAGDREPARLRALLPSNTAAFAPGATVSVDLDPAHLVILP